MKFLILHSSTSFLCQAHSCNLQVLSCKHILSIWYNDQQSVVALVVATSCVNIPVVVTTSSRITVLVQISCIHYIHHHQLHILYTYNIHSNRKLVPVSTGSISFLHVSTYTSSSISLILDLQQPLAQHIHCIHHHQQHHIFYIFRDQQLLAAFWNKSDWLFNATENYK